MLPRPRRHFNAIGQYGLHVRQGETGRLVALAFANAASTVSYPSYHVPVGGLTRLTPPFFLTFPQVAM